MRLFAGTPFDRPPRCEVCGELEADCRCPPPPVVETPPEQQTLKLSVEKRNRGKLVTVVRGLRLSPEGLAALLTKLKSTCGAGGTVADGNLEIQGDHVGRLRTALAGLGFRIRG
ncbi:MAG: translation initiation factor [Planctomyces sp.]|nr:translation initiation factor [Planctomyces sp.]